MKRGQGHLEMIMSFTLFIGFVVTVLLFFRPTIKSKDVSLGTVERALISNLSTNFSFFSAKIPGQSGCFCFSSERYPISERGVIVLNSNRDKINAGVSASGNKICVTQDNAGTFFYVYLSSEFDRIEESCGTFAELTEGNTGLIRESQVISNKALYALKERYNASYNDLRSELRIDYDFRIAVFDNLGNKIFEVEKTVPLGRPVYSKDIPVEIIYANGDLKKAPLKFMRGKRNEKI